MTSMRPMIFIFLLAVATIPLAAKHYAVQSFGIKADGVTVNTASIQYATHYTSAHGGGRLVFSAGTHKTGSIYHKSDVALHLEKGATLMSTTNPFDFVKDPDIRWMSMIFAKFQKNIGITGAGTIDGRGFETANNMVQYIQRGVFDDVLKYDRPSEVNRPQNIHFYKCENVVIKEITLKDPASWNQTYEQCVNVLVDGITVDSKSYWNNDGIDIVDCDGVVIRNSYFDAADDVI